MGFTQPTTWNVRSVKPRLSAMCTLYITRNKLPYDAGSTSCIRARSSMSYAAPVYGSCAEWYDRKARGGGVGDYHGNSMSARRRNPVETSGNSARGCH